MNMIKKFAVGLSAMALSTALVACGDDSSAEVTIEAVYSTDSSTVTFDGAIVAPEGAKIYDVTYSLVDSKDKAITGAMLAYSLKQAAANVGKDVEKDVIGTFLFGAANMTDSIPGLELSVDLASIDSASCGELTLTVTALSDEIGLTGGATGETVPTNKEIMIVKPCGKSGSVQDPIELPDFSETVTDPLVPVTDSIGGAKASLASSFDLDAGKKYSSKELTATVIDSIDIIFNGSKIMTPWGTSEVGYMSKTFANSSSEALIIPVAATADPKSQADMIKLIEDDKAVYVADVNASTASKFIVVTSVGIPVFVTITTIDGKQVMTFKYAK